MAGFDFFRSRRPGYLPRTPAAALRAVGSGTVPVEQFVHASTSSKPLDEEPFDLEEIERVMGRPSLNLPSSVLLRRVLEKLIESKDQEVALFGAEGINALESRALARVETLRTELKNRPDPAVRRRLAREYFEMAELQAGSESVRTFYLREAYASLCGEEGETGLTREDLPLAVDVLVARRLLEEAEQLLAVFSDAGDVEVQLMTARVAFHRGRYRTVAATCRVLAARGADVGGVGEEEKRVVSFWADRDA